MSASGELTRRFACFGTEVGLYLGAPPRPELQPAWALDSAVRRLVAIEATLSRFRPDSELCRLNADPRSSVPVSSLMRRFVAEGIAAARRTEGLVDFTLVDDIERAGYGHTRVGQAPLDVHELLSPSMDPRAAGARGEPAWRAIGVDPTAGTVTRPPGVRFDSGGLGKGLAADLAGEALARWSSYAVDCGGDVRLGGASGLARPVAVEDPFGREIIHRLSLRDGGVATSGITRRSWRAEGGQPTHHLLNPATGLPARTGVVQATAIAATATEAEILAKAALLAGPEHGRAWLRQGGVLVLESGEVQVLDPQRELVAT